MMSLEELRKNFAAKSPYSVLRHLANYRAGRPPLLTVSLTSGTTFRGYLVNISGDGEPSCVFQHEVKNEGDGAAELCYVEARRIESVTVWNVEDYPGALPK